MLFPENRQGGRSPLNPGVLAWNPLFDGKLQKRNVTGMRGFRHPFFASFFALFFTSNFDPFLSRSDPYLPTPSLSSSVPDSILPPFTRCLSILHHPISAFHEFFYTPLPPPATLSWRSRLYYISRKGIPWWVHWGRSLWYIYPPRVVRPMPKTLILHWLCESFCAEIPPQFGLHGSVPFPFVVHFIFQFWFIHGPLPTTFRHRVRRAVREELKKFRKWVRCGWS